MPAGHDTGLLDRCLGGLARQTDPAGEVIVVTTVRTSGMMAATIAGHDVTTITAGTGVLPTWAGFDAATHPTIVRVNPRSNPAPDHLSRVSRVWERARPRTPGFTVVGVSGPTRFEIPGRRGDLLSDSYRRAHGASVGRILGHQPFYGTNYSLSRDWWWSVRRLVCAAGPRVSEDVHLSFAVRPGETIWYDPELRVAARPDPALPGKVRDGIRTLTVNLLGEPPHERRFGRMTAEGDG
ncbi:glycosyl transferase family A [Corynebacterium pygosceleis]|uniref:Glycosyl transferase family A n=1 Tax=Corynebacterium pygosceleis TaxID=2800406 RepID=A0A9Q4C7L9_9CORY|nr:glycosyl transferase family A [Corynebacterium pygosceleis]MCK7637241.1 glycosyl transferase family A [Corynebacterium pygosceleis]MCK7676178.1 glycosyl transferase family A [Corynebacterium pygosceleis]MCL0119984.1 glycosyl transferase family A [Corynebacterium pygosceleis]MCX7445144.1 glycosyl transferase family A [Corynebacterium pygosceleis]MCX7468431.1 glycosyl transferase family A [Corynebacterium pygosceleis]